jgi:hypothetical protein
VVAVDLPERLLRAGHLDRRAERDVDIVRARKRLRQPAEIDDAGSIFGCAGRSVGERRTNTVTRL